MLFSLNKKKQKIKEYTGRFLIFNCVVSYRGIVKVHNRGGVPRLLIYLLLFNFSLTTTTDLKYLPVGLRIPPVPNIKLRRRQRSNCSPARTAINGGTHVRGDRIFMESSLTGPSIFSQRLLRLFSLKEKESKKYKNKLALFQIH